MIINKNKIFFTYFFLYISMYIGFFYNEDFVLGTIGDYNIHLNAATFFSEDIIATILKYDNLEGGRIPHSPIYVLYFMFMQNFFGDMIGRLINMHFILLLPYFVYLSLKLKFNFKNDDIKKLLPVIFFISPYFRAGAFWIDDNIIGLTFLTISFYFYLKFEKNENNDLNLIFLHVLFIALASYFRPIYCIFSVYFFFNFYTKLHLTKKFFYYNIFNLILSAPAFYFIVILGQNEWFRTWLFRTNNITTFSLALSVLFFYTIPFIICNFNKLQLIAIDKKILLFSVLYLIILLLNFDYTVPYSGGIFYKISKQLFSNNYLFYFISFLSFYYLLLLFKKLSGIKYFFLDLILLVLLIFMEVDGVIYHEAYDPLFYILSFLFIKNTLYSETIKNLSFKSINILFIFSISFLIISAFKSYV